MPLENQYKLDGVELKQDAAGQHYDPDTKLAFNLAPEKQGNNVIFAQRFYALMNKIQSGSYVRYIATEGLADKAGTVMSWEKRSYDASYVMKAVEGYLDQYTDAGAITHVIKIDSDEFDPCKVVLGNKEKVLGVLYALAGVELDGVLNENDLADFAQLDTAIATLNTATDLNLAVSLDQFSIKAQENTEDKFANHPQALKQFFAQQGGSDSPLTAHLNRIFSGQYIDDFKTVIGLDGSHKERIEQKRYLEKVQQYHQAQMNGGVAQSQLSDQLMARKQAVLNEIYDLLDAQAVDDKTSKVSHIVPIVKSEFGVPYTSASRHLIDPFRRISFYGSVPGELVFAGFLVLLVPPGFQLILQMLVAANEMPEWAKSDALVDTLRGLAAFFSLIAYAINVFAADWHKGPLEAFGAFEGHDEEQWQWKSKHPVRSEQDNSWASACSHFWFALPFFGGMLINFVALAAADAYTVIQYANEDVFIDFLRAFTVLSLLGLMQYGLSIDLEKPGFSFDAVKALFSKGNAAAKLKWLVSNIPLMAVMSFVASASASEKSPYNRPIVLFNALATWVSGVAYYAILNHASLGAYEYFGNLVAAGRRALSTPAGDASAWKEHTSYVGQIRGNSKPMLANTLWLVSAIVALRALASYFIMYSTTIAFYDPTYDIYAHVHAKPLPGEIQDLATAFGLAGMLTTLLVSAPFTRIAPTLTKYAVPIETYGFKSAHAQTLAVNSESWADSLGINFVMVQRMLITAYIAGYAAFNASLLQGEANNVGLAAVLSMIPAALVAWGSSKANRDHTKNKAIEKMLKNPSGREPAATKRSITKQRVGKFMMVSGLANAFLRTIMFLLMGYPFLNSFTPMKAPQIISMLLLLSIEVNIPDLSFYLQEGAGDDAIQKILDAFGLEEKKSVEPDATYEADAEPDATESTSLLIHRGSPYDDGGKTFASGCARWARAFFAPCLEPAEDSYAHNISAYGSLNGSATHENRSFT